MPESIDYKTMKTTPATVYVIQEIAGTKDGRPKINIMGAAGFGKFNLLKWDKQERKYYPIEINLHEKGNINESN